MFDTFCFSEHSARDAREASRINAGVSGKCLLGLLNFRQIWIISRYFSRVRKHTLHITMQPSFLQLWREDGQTEGNEGTKRCSFMVFFPELTQTVTQRMYIAADCCSHRQTTPVMFICTRAQHFYCTNTVQTVQCAAELYLQQIAAAATATSSVLFWRCSCGVQGCWGWGCWRWGC